MSEAIKTTDSSSEEQRTSSRRKLLKILAAGGGAVAASALLPGSWVAPVVEIGVLPAHAQSSSTVTDYFLNQGIPDRAASRIIAGPYAIKASVDAATGIAHVEANNNQNTIRLGIDLNIDGTASNAFSVVASSCSEPHTPKYASWMVVGFTLGDPTIRIGTVDGENNWEVVLPLGSDTLPDLYLCM